MKNIEVYTTNNCPYCIQTKALLDAKNLSFEEINIESDPSLVKEMITRSKQRTVPQIFIDGQSIGGYDDLARLNASGKLNHQLE